MVRAARRPLTAALTAALVPIPLHAPGHHRRHHRSGQQSAALQSVKLPGDSREPRRHSERKRPSELRHRSRNHHRHAGVNAPLAFAVGRPRHPARAAHAAGDPGNTITDFKFTPHTITIHPGDTITWTNLGPSPHTATATNGSFDTGTLKKGASASHTFSTPGTFTYICTIHPFMHGTVVVLASTPSQTSPTGSPGSGSRSHGTSAHKSSTSSGAPGTTTTPASGSSPITTPTASANGKSLPNTGLDLPVALLTAALLLGAGAAIRRAAGARGTR